MQYLELCIKQFFTNNSLEFGNIDQRVFANTLKFKIIIHYGINVKLLCAKFNKRKNLSVFKLNHGMNYVEMEYFND